MHGSLPDLIGSVKAQGLEGLVAKKRSGIYEPGQRSGSWQEMRVNQGQKFVIGGYTPSDRSFDALLIGYREKGKLLSGGRTRNGFTPPLRAELMKRCCRCRPRGRQGRRGHRKQREGTRRSLTCGGVVQLLRTPACHEAAGSRPIAPAIFIPSGIHSVRAPHRARPVVPASAALGFTPPCGLSSPSFARSVSFSEKLAFFSLWIRL